MARPPFDLLRACFWLVAVIMAVLLVLLLTSAAGCLVMVLAGRAEPGTCVKLGLPEMMHDWWSEMLTAVLALLAVRGPRPPPEE